MAMKTYTGFAHSQSADACFAPVCASARLYTVLDAALLAVSIFIIRLLIRVRIIPNRQA